MIKKRDRVKYGKEYWKKNKKRLIPLNRKYWGEYSKRNKDIIREKSRKYYSENQDKIKKYQEENKSKISNRHREYYQEHKIEIRRKWNIYYKEMYERNMASWIGFIPKEAQCEICGVDIYLGKSDRQKAIHFDHKNGNEKIKTTPSSWLCRHKRNSFNETVWTSCNFGKLCKKCNSFLPTKNRHLFIKKVVEYMEDI